LRRSRRWAGNRAVIRRQGGAPRCAFPQVPAAPWWNCRRHKPKPIPSARSVQVGYPSGGGEREGRPSDLSRNGDRANKETDRPQRI